MFNNQELSRQYFRIAKLIDSAKKFEPDDEIQSHLAKYLCVLCSGFLENAVYNTFSDIVDKVSGTSIVSTYAKSQLSRIQNVKSEKMKALAKSFDSSWHDPFRDFLQKNNRSTAINYITTERHNVAHGRDSDITIIKLEGYLNKVVEVIKYIEDLK